MSNDEKKCPLTKMTCYGHECGMWDGRECGLLSIAEEANLIRHELTFIRKEMENGL